MAAPQTTLFQAETFYGPIHVAMTWGGNHGTVDMDLSAVAYTADGNQVDVAYFKKPSALNGAIGSMGDAKNAFGYSMDKEGMFIHPNIMPPEVNFIFFLATVNTQGATFLNSGATLRIADGQVAGGRHLTSIPIGHMGCQAVLAAVLIRSPAHVYPPGWTVQVTAQAPQAQGAGVDFNEATHLIEGYLQASIPAHLLANRPPHNPMEQCDLSKNDSYVLHPSVRHLRMGLGWSTSADLDAHCFVLDEWYQKVTHVYHGRQHDSGLSHSGDDKNGLGNPNLPDEVIGVNLDGLHPSAKHIVFFVNISQGEERQREVTDAEGNRSMETYRLPRPSNFAEVPLTFARMVHQETGQVLCYFPLSNDPTPGPTRLMCCLTKYGPQQWSMMPLGTPFFGDPGNSEFARRALIAATRPDLMRPVRITFGPVCGTNLVAKDKGGTSDPFFSAKFYDGSCQKTKKIKKTLNPEWNCPDLYTWTGPFVDLLDRIEAKLDVYDHDKWGLNDFMGRAYLHIREVVGTRGRGVQQRVLKLGQKHEGESKEVSGEITVQWLCEAQR